MENHCIDIGNTLIKIGIFKHNKLVGLNVLDSQNESLLHSIIDGLKAGSTMIFSSVRELSDPPLTEKLKKRGLQFNFLTPIPILNTYNTPETLGLDRLAAAVGAWTLFPNQPSLIVDLGTCIKFDFVDKAGRYLGGNISPGMQMRFSALNHYTDKLPLLSYSDSNKILGDSTTAAITTGVVQGITEEIRGTVSLLEQKFGKINIILTGGDTSVFEKRLKLPIFAAQYLVLIGLDAILNYNNPNP